jgi:hypothetical protein
VERSGSALSGLGRVYRTVCRMYTDHCAHPHPYIVYFFPFLDTQVPHATALHTSEVTPRAGAMGCRRPSTSARCRIVTASRREEAVISSSDGITFSVLVRPQSRSDRAAPSERYPNTTPFSTVNERARHPDPNSLTDLADLCCDFASQRAAERRSK